MKRTIIFGALLAVLTAALGVLLFLKTSFIIEYGIVAYRNTVWAAGAALAIAAVLFLIFLAADLAQKKKERAARAAAEKKASEPGDAQINADLSVRKKLDAGTIRQMLLKERDGRWNLLEKELDGCLAQLARMDDYQAKLADLLALNDARSLKDTEDVLDQVEQYICKNMRKAINYLNILDPSVTEDCAAARSKLLECTRENEESLKRTQEFLLALTDFLNRQGDGSGAMDMLEIYRTTILDSIRD